MSTDVTPFTGRRVTATVPTRLLHRFTKPGHMAEIRERRVTEFAAFEWFVYIDGEMTESQMFHGALVDRYPANLAARVQQFVEGGWIESAPGLR